MDIMFYDEIIEDPVPVELDTLEEIEDQEEMKQPEREDFKE